MIASNLVVRIAHRHRAHLMMPAAYLVAATLAGCAPARLIATERAAPTPVPTPATTAANATAASAWFARSFLGSIRGAAPLDESIGLRGTIGTTVNQVVPIPGTDMIKVGAVQEGTLFQSSFRNPTQDSNDRAGSTPNGAVILFHIDRP